MKKIFGFLLIALFFMQCTDGNKNNGKTTWVATTGMIADALKNIGGDSVEVIVLMGAGVDPHLYKATQGDLEKLNKADVVVYNGLHLEGKMGEVLEKIARQKTVLAMADGIPKEKLRSMEGFQDTYDPHIWFDVALWKNAVAYISGKLQEKYPEKKEYLKKNTETYLAKLDSLDRNVKTQIATIPNERRVLITAHDAFGYFGRAYQIEVRGLQGISTVSEFGLNDRVTLVNFIVSRKIKAVFVESSVSPKSIEAVVSGCKEKGHNVIIGGTLFSDAMGADGTFEGTYVGMVTTNTEKIVSALK